MEVIRLQDRLEGMVSGKPGVEIVLICDRVGYSVLNGRRPAPRWVRRVFGRELRIRRPNPAPKGGWLMSRYLELVNAVISNVANLENKSRAQLLLNVEIPFLGIRGFQIVLDARDVEGRLRSAGAEDWNAYPERNRSARNDRKPSRGADWILRQTFLKLFSGMVS